MVKQKKNTIIASKQKQLEKPKFFRHHSSSAEVRSSTVETHDNNTTTPLNTIPLQKPSSSFSRSKSLSSSPPMNHYNANGGANNSTSNSNNNTNQNGGGGIRRNSSRDLLLGLGTSNDEMAPSNNTVSSFPYPPRAPSRQQQQHHQSHGRKQIKQRAISPAPPQTQTQTQTRNYYTPSPPMSPSTNAHKRQQQQEEEDDRYLFQKKSDRMKVAVRTVDLASRTAFERMSPIMPSELLDMLQSSGGEVRQQQRLQKRVSPSISHCQILEMIYNQRQVRQLAWSVSVHPNADPWNGHDGGIVVRTSRKNVRRRDGTFVDRMDYISTLPTHPPVLSHVRGRLPIRADVGFPHTTEEEVKLKQKELQREAECEEVTPRLIVMVSGEDVQQDLEPDAASLNDHWRGERAGVNVFSPPLDASRSSTLGWRPRPFSDRPPGLQHIVVSPLELRFDVGDIEPLICTLSLYCIPNPNQTKPNAIRGKISEDFIFPAGDWKDLLKEEAAQALQKKLGEEFSLEEEKRKKKALFCYDPLAVPNRESLYVVMQVHKTTQADAMHAYVNTAKSVTSSCPSTASSHANGNRTPKKKLLRKPKLFRKKVVATPSALDTTTTAAVKDVTSIQAKAKLTFDTLGTQFLTPIGFGIVPVFTLAENSTEEVLQWPNGLCQSLQLYSFPDTPESQEDFCDRLTLLVRDTHRHQLGEMAGDASHTTATTRPVDNTRTSNGYTTPWMMQPSSATPMAGKAILFLSMLGIDFTQVMLHVPKPLLTPNTKNVHSHHPRLLVDVSGDCAIMTLRPDNANAPLRRSNLVRLPPKTPSGYSDSSDVREVLYFPSIPNQSDASASNDPITPFLSKSFLNLLYLYPRSIQLTKQASTVASMDGTTVHLIDKCFSIRIRVMQQVPVEEGDMTWNVLEHIYNPAPGKQQLVKAIYTKIPHCSIPRDKQGMSIPLRDEVKLRLPLLLDGTYFLHFTLFCIDLTGNVEDDADSEEDSLVVIPLAETMIPLSSYSKNSITSSKVTTVIPNGVHRMNLGPAFQFLLETKLASSIHISDPIIATILRDVAVHREEEVQGGIGRSFSSHSGMFWMTKPANRGGLGSESILQTLEKASDAAILSHFHSIMYLLLSNLVSFGAPELKCQSLFLPNSSSFLTPLLPIPKSTDSSSSHLSFWMEHIKALLEMFHFVKIRFLDNPQKLQYFVKDFCDGFDESCFFQTSSDTLRLNNAAAANMSGMSEESAAMSDVSTGIHLASMTGKRMDMAMSTSTDNTPDKIGAAPVHPFGSSPHTSIQMEALAEMAVNALEQKLLEAAVHVVVQHYSGGTKSLSKKYSSLDDQTVVEQSEAFFSRKAYGVSKTDRMLAEAEFEEEAARYARLWEDDETTIVYNKSSHTLDISGSMEDYLPKDEDDRFSVTSDSYDDTPPTVQENTSKKYRQFPLTDRTASSRSLSVTSPAKSFRGKIAGTIPYLETTNGFAKRVNSVAQVMIAPCMAPNLTDVLAVGNTHNGNSPTWSPRKSRNANSFLFRQDSHTPSAPKNAESVFRGMSCPTCCTEPKGSSAESGVLMVPSHFACCLKEDQREGSTKTGVEPSFCDPGSDVEEELEHYGSASNIRHLSSQFQSIGGWTYTESSKLRGRHAYESTPLEFSLQFSSSKKGNSQTTEKGRPFFYEICFGLWISSWMDHGGANQDMASSPKKDKGGAVFSEHAAMNNLYDTTLSTRDSITSCFAAHLDFLLPLCLKSIVLRCSAVNPHVCSTPVPISNFDARHMQVLLLMVEIWATGLYTQALSSEVLEQEDHTSSTSLFNTPSVIQLSDTFIDFLLGLFTIIHPAQVSLLLEKYLHILKSKEPTPPKNRSSSVKNSNTKGDDVTASSWTSTDLLSLQCSHRLRLRVVERIAVISQFVALNFPLKYSKNDMEEDQTGSNISSWTYQMPSGIHGLNVNNQPEDNNCPYPDGLSRLPREHWLAELLVNECLSICMLSCESIVAEAMAHLKNTSSQNYNSKSTSNTRRRNMVLSRDALIQFQTTAMQSITCLYNHLLRRHCMDARYQSEEGRTRIASLFVIPIIHKSLEGVKVLSRMDPTHKVRLLWLLCFLYIHQEAPVFLIRKQMRNCCGSNSSEIYSIHRYIRLLKLGSITFQRFMNWNDTEQQEQQQNGSDAQLNNTDGFVSENSTWLVQESFNTLCATTILLVDECADIISSSHVELRKMAYSVFDLLLHILAIPHSSVTHLRALGGASHAVAKFSVGVFLKSANDNLQHWARVVLTLMNSTSLSVRSMAVDFLVSLLGGVFEMHGNVDEISLSFVTVMPEIVAREIGLYSTSRQISTMADVESCLWPLRRAFADVEEANPLDDDRVDAQLSPLLAIFCRTCQAIIDGVLIELRLMGKQCQVVGTHVNIFSALDDVERNEGLECSETWAFDADEESLYEAANFFLPETAPLQRIRWLMTLKSLHESKSQWVEAAETLFLCARTIADSILHIKSVWRPSRFNLWQDSRRSLWLSTVGESTGNQDADRGNSDLIEFADRFLEPPSLLSISTSSFNNGNKNSRLHQPTVSVMCKMLTNISKEGVSMYLKEDGMESLAYLRLEQVLKNIMDVVDSGYSGQRSGIGFIHGTLYMEESAALRKLSASVNADMTKLAERMLLLADKEDNEEDNMSFYDNNKSELPNMESSHENKQPSTSQYYVRVILLGKKPERFKESTAIPTFLEWENPSICRVKQAVLRASVLHASAKSKETSKQPTTNEIEARICSAFAEPLISALSKELPMDSIVLRMNMPSESTLIKEGSKKTFVVVSLVHMSYPGYANAQLLRDSSIMEILSAGGSKRFLFYSREGTSSKYTITGKSIVNNNASSRLPSSASGLMELTVGLRFPCALSRQRTIITSEYFS